MAIETVHLANVVAKHGSDMTGKFVAITGTTSGTGFVCARELAAKGATVYVLNRASSRSATSLSDLQAAVPREGAFEAIECDLQKFESVKAAAAAIKAKTSVLDVLVCNAGVMALKDYATADGYDVQMQTNQISHFLLTKELFPLLTASAAARVVIHTSAARLGPPLEAKYFGPHAGDGGTLGGDGTDEESQQYKGPRWARYHQTKLANCCFCYGLKRKLEAAGVTNVMPLLAHPGLALTSLQTTTAADGGMETNTDFMKQAQTAEDGACGIIRCAMDPDAKSGDFFGPTPNWIKGYPDPMEPEDLLTADDNVNIAWDGCEKAVGPFPIVKPGSA